MAAPAPSGDTSHRMESSDGAIHRDEPRERERREARSPWSGLLAVATVILVGWIDWFTGLDVGFSLFYLFPIAWAGWRAGRGWALTAAVIAAASWLFAELAWHDLAAGPILWNGFTRLVIFCAVGWMLAVLREDRIELESLNGRLRESLEAQTLLARTDPLTGLPNARWFTEELERKIAARGGGPLFLLYVDIDNFKELNDQYGHAAGDRALVEIADALRASVRSREGEKADREADLAARLGGDEFAIVLAGVGLDGARTIGERIIGRVSELRAAYPAVDLGASIGISCASGGGEQPEDLIRRADRAMYKSKEEGKGRVVVEG